MGERSNASLKYLDTPPLFFLSATSTCTSYLAGKGGSTGIDAHVPEHLSDLDIQRFPYDSLFAQIYKPIEREQRRELSHGFLSR